MAEHHVDIRKDRQKQILALIFGGFLLVAAGVVRADSGYPTRPITVVAAYAPGGSSDLAARTFSQALERYLSANVIVKDRAGAGGIVGTNVVYQSQPDGYTLLLGRVATLAVVPALENVPYDPEKFTYLGLISKDPYTCVTSANKPYKTLADLKQAIHQKPGSLTYSSSGVGTLTQIAAVKLLDALGAKNPRFAATHIPYKGEGPAIAAVVGGHVDFFCGNVAPMLQQIKAGKLRPFFVTTQKRLNKLKDVPTASELGYPALSSIIGWSAIVAPPNLNDQAKQVLLKAMKEVKHDKKWRQKVNTLGSIPAVKTPKETRAFVHKQYMNFKTVVKRLNLKVN